MLMFFYLFLLFSDATSQHGRHIMIRCTSYKIIVQWIGSFVGPRKFLVMGPPKFSCSSRFGGYGTPPGKMFVKLGAYQKYILRLFAGL